jgi:hypothetical protein
MRLLNTSKAGSQRRSRNTSKTHTRRHACPNAKNVRKSLKKRDLKENRNSLNTSMLISTKQREA